MRKSMMHLLTTIFLVCMSHLMNATGDINSFGWRIEGNPLPTFPFNHSRVYILPYFATKNGLLFAFSALVLSQDPAIILLYRPESSCNITNLMPVGQYVYYPSVPPGWRENVYLESFYQNGWCVPVKRYDVIGLHFPSGSPSISYYFKSVANNIDQEKSCRDGIMLSKSDTTTENLGRNITLDPVAQPYSFELEVYYYTSDVVSNPPTCAEGISIPSNHTFIAPPSTTTPNYKGSPGVKGENGPRGETGFTGNRGSTGKSGPIGPIGVIGPTGNTGPTGLRGPTGYPGDTGFTGGTGLNGTEGYIGPIGAQGNAGPQGEPGLPGLNYTVNLLKPSSESPSVVGLSDSFNDISYFNTEAAISSLFAWLAIVSLVVAVSLILIIIAGISICTL